MQPTASAFSSMIPPASGSRRISVMSGSTAPRAIFWASTPPKKRRASRCRMRADRSTSPTSASRSRASTQCKHWTNPHGWREVVAFLKGRGFRVICIDQKAVNGQGIVWNAIPHGVEDETGDRPLTERARWLRHCAAFVGLSSGLSWLAWAAGCPVVMVSGFTHPNNEFDNALSRDQLAHLQQLLERCSPSLRPQGFSLLPTAQGHRPAVRMHPADHRRAGDQFAFRRVPAIAATLALASGGGDALDAAHIGPQRLRHADGAIRLLVGLHHRDQACDRPRDPNR